jgi:Protein of unknown function (DUF3119)
MMKFTAIFLFFAVYVHTIYCLIPQNRRPTGNSVGRFDSLTKLSLVEKSTSLTIPKNYNVAIGSFATSAALLFGAHNLIAAVPFGLLGILLIIQTGKVRFVFDKEAMEVFVAKKDDKGDEINASRENFVVGGKNRWKYSTFTNWFFIPSKNFPILMYFKENQTSPEGQVHLFPVIMDGKILYDTLMEKVGPVSPAK